MKRIKLSWKNKGVAIIWPDHPLVIAGNEVLERIVSQIENEVQNTVIADYLVKKFNVPVGEAMEYKVR